LIEIKKYFYLRKFDDVLASAKFLGLSDDIIHDNGAVIYLFGLTRGEWDNIRSSNFRISKIDDGFVFARNEKKNISLCMLIEKFEISFEPYSRGYN